MTPARAEPGESMQLARRAAETFGRSPSEIRRARRLMRACLDGWDLRDEDRDALVLVVGELIMNAAQHGRGSVGLYVNASDTVVRIEVSDQGGGQPHLRPVELFGPRAGGLGLQLVDRLADIWGTAVRPGRTVVWVQRTITA